MKLTKKKQKELILKTARAIAEALNPPPVISVHETMEVLGLAVFVYITQVNQDLREEEED